MRPCGPLPRSVLSAVVHVGEHACLGEGFEASIVVHLHEDTFPRFVAYELRSDGELQRVPGVCAPDPDEEPPSPITDLLLAMYSEGSTVG